MSNYTCARSVLIIQKLQQTHISLFIQRVPISNGVNEPKAEVQWPSLFSFPRCRHRCFLNVSWACIKSEYFIVDFIICLLNISLYLRVHINPTRQWNWDSKYIVPIFQWDNDWLHEWKGYFLFSAWKSDSYFFIFVKCIFWNIRDYAFL